MSDEPAGGLPNAALGIVYGVVMAGTLVVAGGVMIGNAMACDSGGDNCANGMILATLTWGFISFVLPIAALTWGLVSSRSTRTGRRNRVLALIAIIILPMIGLVADFAILFNPAFH